MTENFKYCVTFRQFTLRACHKLVCFKIAVITSFLGRVK